MTYQVIKYDKEHECLLISCKSLEFQKDYPTAKRFVNRFRNNQSLWYVYF